MTSCPAMFKPPFRDIEAAVIDFDATLVDTWDIITDSKLRVLRMLGLPPVDYDLVASTNAMHLRDAITICTGFSGSAILSEAQKLYRKVLREESLKRIRLFADAPLLLDALRRRGLKIGVVSVRTGDDLDEMMAYVGLDSRVDAWISEDRAAPKPAPNMVWQLLEGFGVADPSHALTLGDCGRDIEMGRAAGTVAVAAAFEPSCRRVLDTYGPDATIDHLYDLVGLLA